MPHTLREMSADLEARTARPPLLQPTREAEFRNERLPWDETACDARTLLRNHERSPLNDKSFWSWKPIKPSHFTPKHWRKSLRFIRIATVGLSLTWTLDIGHISMLPTISSEIPQDHAHDFFDAWASIRQFYVLQVLLASLIPAWDILRILHSLYQRAPGYHYDFDLFIELCIWVACVLDWINDLLYFGVLWIPAYHALWKLPAVLVSLCIAWRHARRYPSRRRERIRYATLKPQLAFTASGRPVAVYLPQTYELVDVSRLSIDSLQADRDSQSSGSEHQRRISHSFAGYQQASTNLAL